MANREKQDMTAELAEGKILPLVFKLTIPAVIAQLITFLYNIVDRMYVARIEGSGMDALAALGIVHHADHAGICESGRAWRRAAGGHQARRGKGG